MSDATMRNDFKRLADERLHKFVADMITLYEIAELPQEDAAKGILLALITKTVQVMHWAGAAAPTQMELYNMVDRLRQNSETLGK